MPPPAAASVVPSKVSPEPTTTVETCDVPLPRRMPDKVVEPVPPFATGNVPVTPVVSGSPVAFVSVPDDGVPSAPPFTTNEPAVPTFTPRAVATPVPKPEMPVESGSPVALVSVIEAGVPYALVPEKVLLSERSVEEAAVIVMFAVPLKETPLMVRAFWSAVAVPALPEIEPVMRLENMLLPEKVLESARSVEEAKDHVEVETDERTPEPFV